MQASGADEMAELQEEVHREVAEGERDHALDLARAQVCLPPSIAAILAASTALRAGSNRPFSSPSFVLTLTGIRRLVVQIKAIDKDDLVRRRASPQPF